MSKSQENLQRLAGVLHVSKDDSSLTKEIILYRRNYYKNKVKAPLMLALVWAFDKRAVPKFFGFILDRVKLFISVWNVMQTVNKYPEPTRDNCHYPLTLALMDIWDEFFQWEDNPECLSGKHPLIGRIQLFRAFRRVMLATTEHDHYYRQREHWFTQRIARAYNSKKIPELMPTEPDRRVCWKEPVKESDLVAWIESNLGGKTYANTHR